MKYPDLDERIRNQKLERTYHQKNAEKRSYVCVHVRVIVRVRYVQVANA